MLLQPKPERSSPTDMGHRFVLGKLDWFLMKGDFLSHISVKNEIMPRTLTCLCIIHGLVKNERQSDQS